MTRYSYAEIKIFLTEEENYFCSDLQKRIVSQLLEENRILRKGLEEIKKVGTKKNPEFKILYNWEAAHAVETLNKADKVGKGEEL